MHVTRLIADLHVADIDAVKGFYTGYLGLSVEEFNLGWVARYTSPDTGVSIQLVTRDAAAPEDPVISVLTDDVDVAYDEAVRLGHDVTYTITTEPWGVRRFFIRGPDGNVFNIVGHRGLNPEGYARVARRRRATRRRRPGPRRGWGGPGSSPRCRRP